MNMTSQFAKEVFNLVTTRRTRKCAATHKRRNGRKIWKQMKCFSKSPILCISFLRLKCNNFYAKIATVVYYLRQIFYVRGSQTNVHGGPLKNVSWIARTTSIRITTILKI